MCSSQLEVILLNEVNVIISILFVGCLIYCNYVLALMHVMYDGIILFFLQILSFKNEQKRYFKMILHSGWKRGTGKGGVSSAKFFWPGAAASNCSYVGC
jgi:hypothetical protein